MPLVKGGRIGPGSLIFIAQETTREANTILSKIRCFSWISNRAIELKTEIEEGARARSSYIE